ncbi:MAG: T9SS type A sorting domain-containing protein [Bacteroidales bacterium]|nr:T9SS type A sorting domain-containing protein [Bacteroidales bacterium]
MKKLFFSVAFVLTLGLILSTQFSKAQNVFFVEKETTYLTPSSLNPIPIGGDTIKIRADRTETLKFKGFEGNENNPIVFINEGGQVIINTNAWGALTFEDCKFIKVSGSGDPNVRYGFKLTAATSGLTFSEYSSDCEAEFIEIEGVASTFFGIYAKKDFGGDPPVPYPIFKNLSIHDTYIHDLAEGMYIGETLSPGMEFHHLRVYNNCVINTLRESVQIANSVEDIEIYNNLFVNAGIADLAMQNNGLQIGSNTIAKVYNNIIINAKGFGVIVLGNGDIELKNNYIQNNRGIFIDDRYAILPYAANVFEANFFDQIQNAQIIENRNEFNDLFIRDNLYSTDIVFFNNAVETLGLLDVSNNLLSEITDFQYTIDEGNFINSPANPEEYQALGPQMGLSHTFNAAPVLQKIDSLLVDILSNSSISLAAVTADNDLVHFESRDLPDFVVLNELSSGTAELILNPSAEDKGVYEFGILVYDESHHAYDRQVVQLSVQEPDNHNPVLFFESTLSLEAASKFELEITATDADNDSLFYAADPLPSFAKIIKNDLGETWLDLQPKITDIGQYTIEITADDGFGSPASQLLELTINQPTLTPGRIVYRINFGGPELLQEPINWEDDLLNSTAVYSSNYFLRTGSWSWSGVNETTAPDNLFGPYRYGTEMHFAFPLTANGRYKVKLFFVEKSDDVANETTGIFDVFLENSKVLNAFNIYQVASYSALEKSFEVLVEDQILNLDLLAIENNAKINGIEISYLDEDIQNQAPVIQAIAPILLNENETKDIPVSISDDAFESCGSLSLITENAPSFLSINQDEAGNFTLRLQPDFDDAGQYDHIILTASDACLESSITISVSVNNTNRLPIFENTDDIVLEAGKSSTVEIVASDADGDIINFSLLNAPDFVSLLDLENGRANLELSPDISTMGNFAFEVRAVDENGGTNSLFINVEVLPAPVVERIVLNTAMITDLVDGGSRYSPKYLVDEQYRDPYTDSHPKSKSWLPAKRISGGPFQAMIDLGEAYYIDFAYLHDMQYTADFHISVGTPDHWTEIVTYNTSSYKQWRKVDLGVSTRYLLVSEYNTIYAYINEIALYGYPINYTNKSNLFFEPENTADYFVIYPNPAQYSIHIRNKSDNQIVDILDITGKILIKTMDQSIDISNLPNGIYFLRLFDYDEVIFQDRFIKH